jgi:hypothetical protein
VWGAASQRSSREYVQRQRVYSWLALRKQRRWRQLFKHGKAPLNERLRRKRLGKALKELVDSSGVAVYFPQARPQVDNGLVGEAQIPTSGAAAVAKIAHDRMHPAHAAR